jgi:hypothetical protein
MRLIRNRRAVALRSHSVKFWLAAVFCLLGVVGDSWQLFQGMVPISEGAFALLSLAFGIAGLAGRFIDQDL